jgi:hypothetical protein
MFKYNYIIEKGINGDRFFAITNNKTFILSVAQISELINKNIYDVVQLLLIFKARPIKRDKNKSHAVIPAVYVFDKEEDVQNAVVTLQLMR